MIEYLTFACALAGLGLMLLAGVGLLRLPDALCRAHAVAKATALGIALILCAVWLDLGAGAAGFKVVLVILFQLATIPVASHLMARVALRADVPLYRGEPPEAPTKEMEKRPSPPAP